VVVDVGTGDGLFVVRSAGANPHKFYIGIDPNLRPLAKVSEKIHRRIEKGGLPNALFLLAAVEDFPAELDGVATEVHVHFPWGSLLRAVAGGERAALFNLRRICAPGATLEAVIGIDPERDRAELERLGLQSLSLTWAETVLVERYRDAGFEIRETALLSHSQWSRIPSSWAKSLSSGRDRAVWSIVATATTRSSNV
jgi:16S rRNA (adenine(1408)-N(1))-methyltransferase